MRDPSVARDAMVARTVLLATQRNWKVVDVHRGRDARKEDFPDLLLLRGPRLLALHFKVEGNFLRPGRAMWLTLLAEVKGVEVRVFRPTEGAEIERLLA